MTEDLAAEEAAPTLRRWSADKERAVTPDNQIMDLLSRRRGRLFCEECIARELRLPNPGNVRAAIDAIGAAAGFRRTTGICSRYGGQRDGIKAG
jgi:hypothetical protein